MTGITNMERGRDGRSGRVGYLRGMDERLQELSQRIEGLEEEKPQAAWRRERSEQRRSARRVPSDDESNKSQWEWRDGAWWLRAERKRLNSH